jgi:hypothetical protein
VPKTAAAAGASARAHRPSSSCTRCGTIGEMVFSGRGMFIVLATGATLVLGWASIGFATEPLTPCARRRQMPRA